MDPGECVFCRIAARTLPADVVFESEHCLAFRDLQPKAPVHILVIPKAHYLNVADLASTSPATLAELVETAAEVADQHTGGQFRLIFNSGASAGQSVFHVHGHVLGGAQLGWTPA